MTVNPTIFSGKVIGARRAMGDYSAIVKVQETDVWAEDEYGKTIAEGESGVDDASVIHRALDVGGKIVLFNLDSVVSKLTINKSDTKVIGINTTLRQQATDPIFQVGSEVISKADIDANFSYTLLTADVSPSDATKVNNEYQTTIYVDNPNIFSVGDWVLLGSDRLYDYTDKDYPYQGELRKVIEVGTDYIVVAGALFDTYRTTDNAKVFKVLMPENIEITGIKMIGTNEDNSIGIRCNFVENLKLADLQLEYFKFAAIMLYNCVNGKVDNITVKYSNRDGYGYGVVFAANCQFVKATRIHGEHCRHVVTFGSLDSYGLPRHCSVKHVTAINGHQDAAIDVHPFAEYITYEDVKIDSYPKAINAGGIGCKFKNIKATNIKDVAIAGFNTKTPENVYTIIEDSEFDLSGTAKLAYTEGGRNIEFRNCKFKNIGEADYFYYIQNFKFIDCEFDLNRENCRVRILSKTDYPVKNVEFNRCKFIGGDNANLTLLVFYAIDSGALFDTVKIYNCEFGKTTGYGISINLSYARNLELVDNRFYDNLGPDLPGDIANLVRARGQYFENPGTATFSGDGSTTDFLIGDHGLVITDPNKIVVKVTPISADAIAASPCVGYVDPDDNTKIRVKFASAPASGTDNVKIAWKVEVV